MNWLIDERNKWRSEIQNGCWHEPYYLQEYRANRNSNLWRSTREVEKLCEYILYLEGVKIMSETTLITCDHCAKDLSSAQSCPEYMLRLTEHLQSFKLGSPIIPDNPELDHIKNFCNLFCLTAWAIRWANKDNNHSS